MNQQTLTAALTAWLERDKLVKQLEEDQVSLNKLLIEHKTVRSRHVKSVANHLTSGKSVQYFLLDNHIIRAYKNDYGTVSLEAQPVVKLDEEDDRFARCEEDDNA